MNLACSLGLLAIAACDGSSSRGGPAGGSSSGGGPAGGSSSGGDSAGGSTSGGVGTGGDSGGTPGDFEACATAADCTLTSPGCCGACEPIIEADLIAVNREQLAAFTESSGCTGVACEACPEASPSEQTRRFFHAACVAGRCSVQDVRAETITECVTGSDCRLRCGSGCCEACGSSGDAIAVRTDADLVQALCGGAPIQCPACACALPESYTSSCVAGRCVVQGLPACEPGADWSCNLDPEMSSIAGTCNPDGTCTCAAGRTQDPASGRCG